jgi:hypothetical protein
MSCACGKCKSKKIKTPLTGATAKPISDRLQKVANKIADMYGLKMGDFDFHSCLKRGRIEFVISMREPK